MKRTLIINATIVNEGERFQGDVLLEGEHIKTMGKQLSDPTAEVIDAHGKYLIPGIIDDQVHFREPGLTHKGTIATESRAGVAGGVTSYIDRKSTRLNSSHVKISYAV